MTARRRRLHADSGDSPPLDSLPMRVPPARILFPPEDRVAILARIDDALTTGQLTLGPIGAELEDAFAARHGTRHAVAVSSGTAALEIILRAIGVEGREVVVPANTFFATAAAAVHAGARLRFVDCDPQTMAIDPADLAACIGPDTAAVVIVHIGGLDHSRHRRDRAAVRGRRRASSSRTPRTRTAARFDGRSAGTFGRAASFSFYPTKVIAGGEGGMIVTDDDDIAEEARVYRDQGKGSFHANFHTRMGANWRMSEPHAAIVLSQLHRLDEFIERRQVLAARYDAALASLDLGTLVDPGVGEQQLLQVRRVPARRHRPHAVQAAPALRVRHRARRARSTTRRCTTSRSSRSSTTAPCPAPSGCARATCACRCTRRSSEADVDYVVESLATALERDDLREVSGGRIAAGYATMTPDTGRRDPTSADTVAVTGGSGFIGSHVVDALLGAGHAVRVLDQRPPLQAEAEWAEVDLLDQDSLTDALKGCGPVFHLAAMADVNQVIAEPAESVAVTALGAARVLEAARRADAGPRDPRQHGVGVRRDPRRRRRRRDAVRSHRSIATSTRRASSRPRCSAPTTRTCSAVPYTVLRYGIPFGPRMRSDLVVAAFLERALRGEPLRIDGDGAQERSFVYVEDLAAAHVLALAPVAENRTYNLEANEPISIRQLAETIGALVGDIEVTFGPSRPGDYRAKRVEQRARAHRARLDSRSYDFAAGLQRTLEWYRRQ